MEKSIHHLSNAPTTSMPAELNKSSRILIAGGGTWAVSTALHLARRGYKDVTIFDSYPIPSPTSAGNDVNKIAEEGKLKVVSKNHME